MFLTCCSFLSSSSLTVFIKFFLIKKSKSSTNLNHKELKQKEATIDQGTTISDSWGKNISCVIFSWDNALGGGRGSFPRGNYLGNKSSERQFSSAAIFRAGDIVREQLSLGQLFGNNHPRGDCPGGNFPDTYLHLCLYEATYSQWLNKVNTLRPEAVAQMFSVKKVFLEILQSS